MELLNILLRQNVSLFQPTRPNYSCIESFYTRKGSLGTSYVPPLVIDPRSELVELGAHEAGRAGGRG